MDSSLNSLLLLHFARAVSNLTIFNHFIIWNSAFLLLLLLLQNLCLLQWALGYSGTERRWRSVLRTHVPYTKSLNTSLTMWGLFFDLSTSMCVKLCMPPSTTVILSPKSTKIFSSIEQAESLASKYFSLLLARLVKGKPCFPYVFICWNPSKIKMK